MPSPAPSPASTPAPSLAPSPSCVPIGDCSAWCDQGAYAEFCAEQGASCPRPFCQSAASTTVPAAPTAAPTAAVPSAPTAAPTVAPSGSCVASLTGLYTDPAVWEPWCAAAWRAGSCPQPFCKLASSLLAKARRHSFPGVALLQGAAGAGRATAAEEM